MRVVFSTFPDAGAAKDVARTLVDEGIVACVNILPGVTSVYRWKGEVQEEAEVLAVIKVVEEGFPALRDRLSELHPYEVPEIVALDVADSDPRYLAWVRGS